MMRMLSAGMSLFHGSSDTETPYSNLYQLTAPDIDLNDFKFSTLKQQVLMQQRTLFFCSQVPQCCSMKDLRSTVVQVVLVVNVASK